LVLAYFSLPFPAQKELAKERRMKKHILAGALIGGLMGVVTAWFAMSDALPQGGLVALAGAFDGIMAGSGLGWLIGINVAEGAVDEAEEELAHLAHGGSFAKAH
jgi:membrane associated rhomboid family serine protease